MRFLKRLIVAWLLITAFDVGAAVRAQNFLISFQVTTVANTVSTFPSNTLYNGIACFASSSNTVPIYIGPPTVTTSTGAVLQAGQGWSAAVNNSNLVAVISTSAASISCWGN